MTVAGVLKRIWIPLAFTVSRVRAGSGSETHAPYPDSKMTGSALRTKKSLVYEVFGPAGTLADISYFDPNSDPRRVDRAPLPWSLQIIANVPTVVGNVVAQGDSNSIGCRIVVNGEVKAERISNEVNGYTHCLVRGA